MIFFIITLFAFPIFSQLFVNEMLLRTGRGPSKDCRRFCDPDLVVDQSHGRFSSFRDRVVAWGP